MRGAYNLFSTTNLVGITPEFFNILLYPFQNHDLIHESVVTSGCLVFRSQESKNAQSKVEGDQDNVVFQEIIGAEKVGGTAAHDKGSSVDVDHDSSLLVVNFGSINIEVQTVLVSSGGGRSNIVLGTNVAVVRGVIFFGEGFNFNGRL